MRMKPLTAPLLAGCIIAVVAGCASAPRSTADARDVKPKECDFPHDAVRETHYRYDPLRKNISLSEPTQATASSDGREHRLAPCQ